MPTPTADDITWANDLATIVIDSPVEGARQIALAMASVREEGKRIETTTAATSGLPATDDQGTEVAENNERGNR